MHQWCEMKWIIGNNEMQDWVFSRKQWHDYQK
jgi:hypothetical protein